jgi:SAM-dependent methyltransferase
MFLAGALRRGFDAHGMDASGAAVDAVRREYSIDVREGSIGSPVWGDERFDFVTLFHVLEHVVEPRQALRYAGSLLRPGGCLIIQVPNVDSAQARIFGKRWYGLDVPRHVIDFSARGLAALLEETGWVVTRGKRFSLRDNPASIASSLVPALDPIGRSGRGLRRGWRGAVAEVFYLGLFTVSVPLAWLEAMAGLGGTLWVAARARQPRISR